MFKKLRLTVSPSLTFPRMPGCTRLATDERGATAVEYALIAAGIGAALAATVHSLGTTTKDLYSSLAGLF
jgi:pilus assembly protein Flp/PilA